MASFLLTKMPLVEGVKSLNMGPFDCKEGEFNQMVHDIFNTHYHFNWENFVVLKDEKGFPFLRVTLDADEPEDWSILIEEKKLH